MKIGIGIVVGFFALLAVIGIGYNLLSDKTLEADSKEKTLIEKTKTPEDKKLLPLKSPLKLGHSFLLVRLTKRFSQRYQECMKENI